MVVLNAQDRSIPECSLLVPLFQSINRPHTTLSAIHQKYGNLVLGRFFKQKLLFVCHPAGVEQVFKLEAKGQVNREFLYQAKKSSFGNGLLNSQNETWIQQRRLMQPFFNRESVSEWGKVMITEAEATSNVLAQADQKINITITLKSLIQRILVKILMGRSVDSIHNKTALIQSIDIINQYLLPIILTHILSQGRLMGLLPGKRRQYQRAIEHLTSFIEHEIAQKHQQQGHDLISLMMQAQDDTTGYAMTNDLLKDETVNLFIAGQETTVNALSWFFYHIGRDETLHKQVTDEIIRFKKDDLSMEKLTQLSYTRAVLNETLRLYPPTPALALQAVDNIVIDGHLINRGTTIILSMYATHRHADYWDRPNEFHADHFFDVKLQEKRPRYAFYPFGGGLHHCIGRHLAELEMMIIIVTLLRAYTFKSLGILKETAGATLKPSRDLMVSLKSL